jgi:hypothetical protein
MGSYAGSTDWDALPQLGGASSFAAFKPRAAPAGATPTQRSSAGQGAGAARPTAPPAPEEAEPGITADPSRTAPRRRLNAVFAFDTTGSMTPWVENVEQKMRYLGQGLLALLDMEIALVGVGDHGDGRNMLQIKLFTRDLGELERGIAELVPTDGRDTPEAFECLFKILNTLDYPVPTVLVLVTDSIPHGMEGWGGDDDGCPFGVDYEAELEELRGKLKNIYLVSCATDEKIVALQRRLVRGNSFLRLADFRRLTNLVMAICMDEVGELDYFMEILERQRGKDRRAEVLSLLGRSG